MAQQTDNYPKDINGQIVKKTNDMKLYTEEQVKDMFSGVMHPHHIDVFLEETKTLKTYIWADTDYSHLEYQLFAVMAYSKEEAKALILENYEKYAGEKFDETLRDTLNEVEPIILSPLEAQLINHANF